MPLFLITSVCNDGVDASSFRVVEAESPLVIAQDMLDNPWSWDSLLRNTGLWWDLTYSEYKSGEPLGWSAEELLEKIDATWIDGDSRNQVRVHEIGEIEHLSIAAREVPDGPPTAHLEPDLVLVSQAAA